MVFNPYRNKPLYLRVCSIKLLKTLGGGGGGGEGKLLVTSAFYAFGRTLCRVNLIRNCSPQTLSVWKSPKFVVWEKVK